MRSRAARELRDRVLTGRLRPGDRLDLDQITEEFGISRTPVREALLELSYEGLVAVTPRSGITVIGISPDDAVDNFAVLATLAGKAAEWATSRINARQLADLHRLADAVEEPDVVSANRRFHRAVNLAAGSPRLLTYLRQENGDRLDNVILMTGSDQESMRQHEGLAVIARTEVIDDIAAAFTIAFADDSV